MIERFQIEELIRQDASGVIFRALDSETGKHVSLWRFFPFGVDGGGLHDDEQAAYHIAIGRLSKVIHPAMRTVVCGGCDPVDGMPYLATEWVDGESLPTLLKQGPLTAESAIALISQALEVCELLSHVLAEDAVWIDTDLDSIIIGSEDSQRPFTFWISPFKWLGGEDAPSKALDSVIALTEEVMGWKGRIISEQAGSGLGGWVKWLRANAANITLYQARQNLCSSVGEEPPPPTEVLVRHATLPLVTAGRPPSRIKPIIIMAVLSLLIAATGTWLWFQSSRVAPASVGEKSKAPAAPISESDRISQRAKQMADELAQNAGKNPTTPPKKNVAPANNASPVNKDGAISWLERERLANSNGKSVTVEGTLYKFTRTASEGQEFINLEFSETPTDDEARGCIHASRLPREETESFLESLVGKPILLKGTVWNLNRPGKPARPLIILTDTSGITEQPVASESKAVIISWSDREKIIQNNGKEIVMEGKVDEVKPSSSGKTLYLMNAGAPGDAGPRAGLEIGSQSAKTAKAALDALVGKKIRVRGKVVVRHIPRNGTSGVDVMFKKMSAIEEVK